MEDQEYIRNTALDYIEGWYEADSVRMKRALHPKMVKRRFVGENEIWDVDAQWMVNATAIGKGKMDNPEICKKKVTIIDFWDNMASVKIISEKFVDYLHMVKTNKTWQIVDVIWDYLPE